MNNVPLEAVILSLESGARPKGGASADSGEIPSIGGEHLTDDGNFYFSNIKRIPISFFKKMKSGHVCPLDILIVKDGATTGKTSFVHPDFPFREAAVNEHVFCVRVNPEKALPAYICHFLRSAEGQKAILRDFRGATVGGISREFATKTVLPLPSLPKQQRIADILDRAEALRAKRRAALAQLNELTQSIFYDMFGDPITNSKGWQRIPFAELLTNIDSGWSPVCLDRPVEGKEWGVLKLGAVTWCEYNPTENKALPDDINPDPKLEVKPGDLLFTRKNTYELVAACALVRDTPPRLMMSDLIFRLRLRQDAEIDPNYLQQLLIFPTKRREIQKLAGGSAGSMPNISKTRLNTAPIEIPPLPLQKEFSRRVATLEKLKASHKASLAELDELFSSLQQHAFLGGL
ncbi:MAG: restriction endonuclease subunit S [Methanosarcina sp.]